MDLIQSLQEVGLGAPEARVYLALYEMQESKTGALVERARVHTSKIYAILDSLIEKGLAGYRIQNNVKIFHAASPDVLAELLQKKERELIEQRTLLVDAISKIKRTRLANPPRSNYKYFEGLNGVRSLWNEVRSEMPSEPLLIYASKKENVHILSAFYDDFHKERAKKKIPVRILHPIEEKSNLPKRRRLPYTEVRFSKQDTLSEVSVFGDFVILQHTERNARGFLIRDKVFADTFKEIFNQLWDAAEN